MIVLAIVAVLLVNVFLFWLLGAMICWSTEDWRHNRPRHQIRVARSKAVARAAAIDEVRRDTIRQLHQAASGQ